MCKGGCGENLESGMNDQIENHVSVDSASNRDPVKSLLSTLAAARAKNNIN